MKFNIKVYWVYLSGIRYLELAYDYYYMYTIKYILYIKHGKYTKYKYTIQ